MVDLQDLRNEIDSIDRQMTELFEKRMEISRKVAKYKISTGKKVFDKEREKKVIEKAKDMTHNDFNRHGIEELFQQIMAMSRKLQYQLLEENGVAGRLPFIGVDELEKENVRVVFQGVEGAYSQAAMQQYFGDKITSFHVEHWRDAMEAIAEGAADYAVLPIENSTAGSVNDMYDLLVEFENYIVGEQIIRCEHCLLGLENAEISDIRTVYSHQQGLSQCKSFLQEHRDWKQIPLENTAMAAKKVAEDGDVTQASVSSAFAAKCFGLKVLKENIYSNGKFYSLKLTDGTLNWTCNGLQGYIESRPAVDKERVYIGTWGAMFYAIDRRSGEKIWEFDTKRGRYFSPGACWPVVLPYTRQGKPNEQVIVLSSDYFVRSFHPGTGEIFWASDEAKGRESLGFSPDGKTMYVKGIKNNITAADISHGTYTSLWNTSMPYESNFIPTRIETTEQLVFIPTEFGVLHAVRTDGSGIAWSHKISHSAITSLKNAGKGKIIVMTMDGTVTCLEYPL